MSITNELRKYASVSWNPWPEARDRLLQMCNRIDAEYERKVAEMTSSWDYWEYTHVELPKDADGMLIHIGDRMEHIELGYVLEVIAVGIDCFIAWNTHLNRYCQYDSKLFRHHHEPTVEDVLREFGERYCDTVDGCAEESELFAEYAAKLQLRGDGE